MAHTGPSPPTAMLLLLISIEEAALAFSVYGLEELRGRSVETPALNTRLLRASLLITATSCACCVVAAMLERSVSKPEKVSFVGFRIAGGLMLVLPYLYLVAVVMGASLISNGLRTVLWALIVAALTSVPLAVSCSSISHLPLTPWRIGATQDLVLRCRVLGTLVGTWFGAMLVPLDWGSPWLEWPITGIVGAVAGHNLGTAVALCTIYNGVCEWEKEEGEERLDGLGHVSDG